MKGRCRLGGVLAAAVIVWGAVGSAAELPTREVDGARILRADSEPHNWLAHGRTYSEQRYSPLDQIDQGNIRRLGLAWAYATGTRRGLEATP